MVYQTMHCLNKNSYQGIGQKIFEWMIKNSNMRESPIVRDTLFTTDAESGVKRRVTKLLLEYSIQQLHTELIASPDDGAYLEPYMPAID